jgi:hypothetical protein
MAEAIFSCPSGIEVLCASQHIRARFVQGECMSRFWKFLVSLFLVTTAHAQMPHQVLLLVNSQSQASLKVANNFAEARGIPKINMVYLNIPESAYGGTATITPEEFTKLIWEPANAAAKKRGIEDHILAWVYSVDFPIRVKTDPSDRKQMSVGGLTFLRNKPVALNLVEEGKYFSKLFAGPNERLKLSLSALSLGMQKNGLGKGTTVPPEVAYLQLGLRDRMPLPSMMLGYIGEKGTDVDTVLKTIERGKAADYHGRRGGIYFITSNDIRSKCRERQFFPAAQELAKRGIGSTISTNFPAGAKNVMGLMMGAETVDPSAIKSFVPGAMAEHLTSWSAEFQKRQTKMTDWLKAGATASAGSVVEPYSNPNKFPSARFFVHYTAGCTMLEAFYQSIACPLQILLLGDPMAKPYAVPFSVTVLGSDLIRRDTVYYSNAECQLSNVNFLYSFLLDGKEISGWSEDPSVNIETKKLADGYHELRGVVCIKHLVEFDASFDKSFTLDRQGRSIAIDPKIEKIDAHEHTIKVKVGGTEMPKRIRLVCGAQILDEKDYLPDSRLILNELMIGEGPNRIQIVGLYADGMEVASPPLKFTIKFTPETP